MDSPQTDLLVSEHEALALTLGAIEDRILFMWTLSWSPPNYPDLAVSRLYRFSGESRGSGIVMVHENMKPMADTLEAMGLASAAPDELRSPGHVRSIWIPGAGIKLLDRIT